MRCTGIGCWNQATVALRWSDQVKLGWTISIDRVYCRPHSDEVIAKLNERGVTVSIVDLAARPAA